MKSLFKIKDSDDRLIPKKVFWLAVCVVLVICIAYAIVMLVWFKGSDNGAGQFGDMFGAVGALFSGLAFAGLIVTMLQQREDLQNQMDEIRLQRQDLEAQTEALRLQKEEIAQTNKELELQRAELQEQNKTIMLQRFENTFFNMLEMQQKIVNELKYVCGSGIFEGRDVFDRMYRNFYDYAFSQKQGVEYKHLNEDSSIQDFLQCFESVISSGQIRYYDNLYRILKLIHSAQCIDRQKKYNYICILRAQLSKPELLMLFYFCLYEDSNKLKQLVEEYALFKHIKERRFVTNKNKDKVLLEKHYDPFKQSAYTFNVDKSGTDGRQSHPRHDRQ